jgi:hypothetical protein
MKLILRTQGEKDQRKTVSLGKTEAAAKKPGVRGSRL